jgi:fibro-slime domain-containing protein
MTYLRWLIPILAACGGNGGGGGGGGDDDNDGVDAPLLTGCGVLNASIRDFTVAHPDFEKVIGVAEQGIMRDQLDADHKPVYARAGASGSVSGPDSFNQWYRDVPGVNQRIEVQLPMVENPPGTYTFDDQDFFPIDGRGLGGEVMGHNYLFTTEVQASFTYRGGERFLFNGDDDVFVFINDRLALDLGGVHEAQEAEIDFDAKAAQLGIQVGNTYSFSLFHAERHTVESHMRMVTTIDCFVVLL